MKKINLLIIIAVAFWILANNLTEQRVLAGDPNAQSGRINNPYNNPPAPRRPTAATSQKKLAAAQFGNLQNQPPTNSGGDSGVRSDFSFFASVFVLFGGIWTLFALFRQRFNKIRGKNHARPVRIWEFVFRPSFALSIFGFLFLTAIVGSIFTKPAAVTAEKRQKPDKSLMRGVDNPSNKPVLKTAQQIGGSGYTQIGEPVFDAAGNRYVRGGFTGTLTIGATTLTATKDFDLFVAKYDANGAAIWARQGSGATSGIPATLAVEGATALAVDAGGNVYIGGSFVKTLTLQGGVNANITLTDGGAAGINYESFVAKYDANGNLLWARGGNSGSPQDTDSLETGQNAIDRIIFDSNGNPYLTGFVSGTNFLGSPVTNAGQTDILLAKLNPANGAVIWKQIIGGTTDDTGLDLKIDGFGNLYMVGNFGSPEITFPTTPEPTTFENPDDPTNPEEDSTNTFIAKFDANGNNLRVDALDNTTAVGISQIAVNAAGEIFMTGYFFDSVGFDGEMLNEGEGGSEDDEASLGGYVAKMDANGDFVWAELFGGIGEGIALDAAGRVYVIGKFYDGGTFGDGTPNVESLASFGGEDVFAARYDADGNFDYAKAIAGSGSEGQVVVGDPSAAENETENDYSSLGIAFNPATNSMFVSGDFNNAVALDCITLRTPPTAINSYIAELSETAGTCRIWNGLDADDNNWDSTDNWNDGIVPNDDDSVYVPYTGSSDDNPTYNPATNIILNNLTVAADRTLTLNKDLAMEGKLALLGGIVDAGANSKLLDLGESATTESVAADADNNGGLVIGRMRKAFGNNVPFTFPVGTANGYSPVDVSPSQAADANLTINAVQQPQPLFVNSANRINRFWTLNQSGNGFLTANLTFHYLQTDVVGDESQFKLFKVEDGEALQQTATINTIANTARVSNVSEFSDWTLAQAAPTAATVSVGGRVETSANGYGLSNAIIELTEQNGQTRQTKSNSFGYFRFDEVETGKTYIISVRHRRYTFAPQVINVIENMTNLALIPAVSR